MENNQCVTEIWGHQLGSLIKPRQRRQQERHQPKGFMSKTIAVHVRF